MILQLRFGVIFVESFHVQSLCRWWAKFSLNSLFYFRCLLTFSSPSPAWIRGPLPCLDIAFHLLFWTGSSFTFLKVSIALPVRRDSLQQRSSTHHLSLIKYPVKLRPNRIEDSLLNWVSCWSTLDQVLLRSNQYWTCQSTLDEPLISTNHASVIWIKIDTNICMKCCVSFCDRCTKHDNF